MKKAKCATVTALLLTSLSALADGTTTYQFDSISKVSYQATSGATTTLTGVLVNDTAPTTVSMPNVVAGDVQGFRCDNLITDMRRSPGTYILSVTITVTTSPPPMSTVTTTLNQCSLERKP